MSYTCSRYVAKEPDGTMLVPINIANSVCVIDNNTAVCVIPGSSVNVTALDATKSTCIVSHCVLFIYNITFLDKTITDHKLLSMATVTTRLGLITVSDDRVKLAKVRCLLTSLFII
jgi:hypothetical protein